jgi:potassium-transporting ATPase KdpC subunit
MSRTFSASLWLLGFTVAICCGVYPLTLWVIGQTVFPEQAEGSLLKGPDGDVVGSRLIAQPFTKDEYFQPRPSAVSYNGAASGASNWGASNYLLRDRVARALGPIVKYRDGAKAGQLAGPDIEEWFQRDRFQGEPHLVAQWAQAHSALAQAWVKADPLNHDFVDQWAKAHPDDVAQWIKDNPGTPEPAPEDLAVLFFESWSKASPGTWPSAVEHTLPDGTVEKTIEPVREGTEIQSVFFDTWRQDHPNVALQAVPADMVMASGSGLDPHITLKNALYQLDRVANTWAQQTHRDPDALRKEITDILNQKAFAPLGGLVGVQMVNVLEVNLVLRTRYGEPGGSAT